MNALDDVARFRADDCGPLVAAAFACPVCLRLDGVARLVLEPDDFEVECACAGCDAEWSVAVDDAQVLRLVLHPPATGGEGALRMLPPRTPGPSGPLRPSA